MKRGKHKSKLWLWFTIGIVVVVAILVSVKGKGANVALIKVEGILVSSRPSGFIPYKISSAEEIIQQIQEASKDPTIKALLLELDSPGGSAVAASEVAQAIKKAKVKKPVVALIREQATSGAYWVSSACSHIIAHPLSITGSIGVLASYLEFSGLLARYNVTYQRLVKGEHKDIMSPYRKLSKEEEQLILEKLDTIYKTFISEVAQNRNLSKEKVEQLADGLFLLGKEALQAGLVDQLGTKDEAIEWIEQKLNITARIKEYEKKPSLFEKLSMLYSQSNFWLGRGIGASLADSYLLSSLNPITPQV